MCIRDSPYSNDLEYTYKKLKTDSKTIGKLVISFLGGCRIVWSNTVACQVTNPGSNPGDRNRYFMMIF